MVRMPLRAPNRRMAQGLGPFEAACCAVAQHGQLANDWPDDLPLTASALAQHLR